MNVEFGVLERHLEAPRAPSPSGKLVLSRLKPGRSEIGAPAPSLKLVIEGEEIYEVDGKRLRVEPGQFLYLDRGQSCTGTNRTETVGLCLILPPDSEGFGTEIEGADPVLGRALVLPTETSQVGRALLSCARQIARDPEVGARIADRLVADVAQAVREPLAASRAAISALSAAKASTRRELYQRLERARHFLHSEQSRTVSLGELASVAGLSQFHLARYFKMAFGKSPIAYHRELRLDRAAELLSSGSRRLADVAELAGYSDGAALSHAFRRQFGSAPQRWQLARAS